MQSSISYKSIILQNVVLDIFLQIGTAVLEGPAVQPRTFHQGRTERHVNLIIVCGWWSHGAQVFRVVPYLVLVFSDCNDYAGVEPLSCHPIPIYLGPISAIQILDKPISLLESHAAVLT